MSSSNVDPVPIGDSPSNGPATVGPAAQELYDYLQIQQQQQINAIVESLNNLQALQRRSPTAVTFDPSSATYDPTLLLNAVLNGDLSKLSSNR